MGFFSNRLSRSNPVKIDGSDCIGGMDFGPDWVCPSPTFIDAQIRREVSVMVDDILEPYTFPEDIGLQNVFQYTFKNIKIHTLNFKDILLDAFLGFEKTISKITLKNEIANGTYLVNMKINDDGTIDVGDYKGVVPEKSLVFTPFLETDEVDIARRNFCHLWNIYQKIDQKDELGKKFFFRMKGFHDLFVNPSDVMKAKISRQNLKLLLKNVETAMESKCAVIDREDEFGVMGGRDSLHNAKSTIAEIDVVYSEIGRIYKIPRTRMLGRSPEGMNSTGEFDEKNYEKTLKGYRKGWVDPFLIQMKIPYVKNEIACIDDIVKLGGLIVSLGLEESFQDLGDIVQSHIKALGGKPFEDFDENCDDDWDDDE